MAGNQTRSWIFLYSVKPEPETDTKPTLIELIIMIFFEKVLEFSNNIIDIKCGNNNWLSKRQLLNLFLIKKLKMKAKIP